MKDSQKIPVELSQNETYEFFGFARNGRVNFSFMVLFSNFEILSLYKKFKIGNKETWFYTNPIIWLDFVEPGYLQTIMCLFQLNSTKELLQKLL